MNEQTKGFIFEVDAGMDLTGATDLLVVFRSPTGAQVEREDVTLVAPSTVQVPFVLDSDKLTERGWWTVQVWDMTAGRAVNSEIGRFYVGRSYVPTTP